MWRALYGADHGRRHRDMRVGIAVRKVILGFVLFLQLMAAGPAAAQPERPNIVLIMVEDLSPRIGAYGDEVARTPIIDQLAREGIRYTNVYTTAGVCSPSRAALITGMHQQTIGAQHMRTSFFSMIEDGGFAYQAVPPPHVKAFPEYLRASGYVTINNHKMDYQFGEPSSIWDASGTEAGLQDRDPTRPFFLMLSDNTSHESGLFVDGLVPRAQSTSPESLKASIVRRAAETAAQLAKMNRRTDPADVRVPPYLPDTPLVRREIAQHYDNIARMDDNVGRVMADLEREGLLDNTIVIWTTDHGDGIARGKRTLYDSGLKVPMIVRFPDLRHAGQVRDELVSFVDLAPTIMALAGAPRPDHLQGQPFLGEAGVAKRSYVFAARDRLDEFPDRSRAVRDSRYKYIRNAMIGRPLFQPLDYRENLLAMQEMRRLLSSGALPPHIAAYFQTPRPQVELFDTESDPHEIRNLAGDPAYGDVQARLGAALDAFLARYRDFSDIPEREMAGTMMWPGQVQPETQAPVAHFEGAGEGQRIVLSSATEGASIEYRLAGTGREERWNLYTGPMILVAGSSLEARAIRYGYKPSGVAAIGQ